MDDRVHGGGVKGEEAADANENGDHLHLHLHYASAKNVDVVNAGVVREVEGAVVDGEMNAKRRMVADLEIPAAVEVPATLDQAY